VVIVILFIWEARDWQMRARLAPWTVGFVVLVIALVQLYVAARSVFRSSTETQISVEAAVPSTGLEQSLGRLETLSGASAAPDDPELVRRKASFIILWTVGFCVGLWLLGFRLGAPILTFGFLRFAAGESFRVSGLFALGAYLCMVFLFQAVVGLPFPAGLIFQLVGVQSPDTYFIDSVLAAVRRGGE
jgi:hypothetical protein